MKTNSPEFRQMQRERIYKTKPWLKATGPKTVEGKKKAKMNDLKLDIKLHYLIKEYKELMIQQKAICSTVNLNNCRENY